MKINIENLPIRDLIVLENYSQNVEDGKAIEGLIRQRSHAKHDNVTTFLERRVITINLEKLPITHLAVLKNYSQDADDDIEIDRLIKGNDNV